MPKEACPSAPASFGAASDRRQPLRITVLAGGIGPERQVSLNSGQAVQAALVRAGHIPTLRDISPEDLTPLDAPTDFVFIALHGAFGEDGMLQAELQRRGIPFSGSGAAASRVAMNKVAAKERFIASAVPTPDFAVATSDNFVEQCACFPVPAVVKPIASGSSVDTSIVRSRERLRLEAGRLVATYGEALLERYIRGPELTVGILGDRALPVCEIRTPREFYDYHAKYLADDTRYLFDLDLPGELLERVQQISHRAHRALGCEVFSRVDCMIDQESMAPYILEVNTIPGFTDHSLLPKSAARIGLSFEGLCERIIALSVANGARAR